MFARLTIRLLGSYQLNSPKIPIKQYAKCLISILTVIPPLAAS